MIIDDTLIAKTGKHIPEVAIFYEHAHRRYILAHNIVISQLYTSRGSFPIGYKLYLKRDKKEKEFKRKIKLATELIGEAIKADLPFNTVVIDA